MSTDDLIRRIAAIPSFVSIALVALLGAAAAYSLWRAVRDRKVRTPAAVLFAALAAAGCTAYSADTSWRFAGDHLGMTSTFERGIMFAAAEMALFSMALMARQNLNTTGAPGTPGALVWVITGVQVIPAFSESGMVGGFVRAFVGPVLAALLWHLAMGIELRHAKPGAGSQSLPAILARELRERLLSRLGLAVRDRDVAQITRDRWTIRAVALATRLSQIAPEKRDTRRARWITRRLATAVARAQAGAHSEQRRLLLDLLAARRHAAGLATVVLPSPWETATTRPQAVICTGHGGAINLTPMAPPATAAQAPPMAPQQAAPEAPSEAVVRAPRKAATKAPRKASVRRPQDDIRGAARKTIRALYDEHGRRPRESEMTAALKKAKLPSSRQFANARRLEVEAKEPSLAALGQTNVRTLTGS